MADHESMTDVACGEPELATDVREALTLLRARSDDDEFRRVVDDVLDGRCSLVDAAGTAAFGAAVFAPIADEFGAQGDTMAAELGSTVPGGSSDGPCGGCTSLCAVPCAIRPH